MFNDNLYTDKFCKFLFNDPLNKI